MQAGKSLLEKGNIFLLKNLPLTVSHPLQRYRKITLTQQNPLTYKECQKGERVEKESKGLKRNNSKDHTYKKNT